VAAAGREPVGDAAVAACEIQHVHARLDAEDAAHHVGLGVAARLAEALCVEMQVVVVEYGGVHPLMLSPYGGA
jgi:hypothetical protein